VATNKDINPLSLPVATMSRNRGSARSTKDSDFAEEHGSQPKRPKRDVLHELGVNFNGFEQTAHRVRSVASFL
jgi:hypothetical protein